MEESRDLVVKKEILTGSTFSIMASQARVATNTVNAILEKTEKVYDLAHIRAGKELVFVFDKTTKSLKELDYDIDTEEKLIIKNNSTLSITALVVGKVAKATISSFCLVLNSSTGLTALS